MNETFRVENEFLTAPADKGGQALLDEYNNALTRRETVQTTSGTTNGETSAFVERDGYSYKVEVVLTGEQNEGFIVDVTVEGNYDFDVEHVRDLFQSVRKTLDEVFNIEGEL